MTMQGVYKERETQNFMADLTMAQRVERATCLWLHNNDYYKKVKLVNQKGYDVACLTHKDEFRKIEIKRDSYVDAYIEDGKVKRRATNNICVEIWSNFKVGNEGWISYSDADLMLYIGNKNIYVIHMERLRQFTQFFINKGKPLVEEPNFKMDMPFGYGFLTPAHKNGNLDVRNVMFNKELLIKKKVILKVLDREECKFNISAKPFNI